MLVIQFILSHWLGWYITTEKWHGYLWFECWPPPVWINSYGIQYCKVFIFYFVRKYISFSFKESIRFGHTIVNAMTTMVIVINKVLLLFIILKFCFGQVSDDRLRTVNSEWRARYEYKYSFKGPRLSVSGETIPFWNITGG